MCASSLRSSSIAAASTVPPQGAAVGGAGVAKASGLRAKQSLGAPVAPCTNNKLAKATL